MLRIDYGYRSVKVHLGALESATLSDPAAPLLQEALLMTDEIRLLRTPTVRGLGALRLLMVLTASEGMERRVHGNDYRSFQAVFVEHFRILAQDGKLSALETTNFFMSQLASDSFGSALSGQIPAFDDDDIALFGPWHSVHLNVSALLENITSAQHGDHLSFDIIMGPLCMLARSIYKHVTSAKARLCDRIDLSILRSIPEELERIRVVLDVYEKKIAQMHSNLGPVPLIFEQMSTIVRFLCKSEQRSLYISICEGINLRQLPLCNLQS